MTRKSIDTVLISVAADNLSQRECDWIKLMKPMDPPPEMVANAILERSAAYSTLGINLHYAFWFQSPTT